MSTYSFNGMDLRVVEIGGEPWFVAKDVCAVLGMDLWAGTTQWLKGLAADERHRATRKELPEIFSGTVAPSLTIISESGLYKLVMRSDKKVKVTKREHPHLFCGSSWHTQP